MKSKIDELAQEEKNKILEMYYGKDNTLNEQKAFSNLKSDVRGFGQRLKTGFQNVASSFSKTQGQAMRPSAGLQQDLTKIQSRSGDLMQTIGPIMNEINDMIVKLQKNENAYGQGYGPVQNEFMTQLNNLKTTLTNTNNYLNGIRTYQPNYQQPATQQQNTQQQNTQQQTQQQGNEQQNTQQNNRATQEFQKRFQQNLPQPGPNSPLNTPTQAPQFPTNT